MIRTFVMSALLLVGIQAFATQTPKIKPGDNAPCVTLNHMNSNGTEAERSTCKSEHSNQNLVLSFFATWCEYCQADLPIYTQIAQKFKGQADFRLIGVDKEASMRDFFKNKDFSMYEIGLDPDLTSYDAFDLEGIPTLVVIGPDGKVKYMYVGEIQQNDIKTVEDNILK